MIQPSSTMTLHTKKGPVGKPPPKWKIYQQKLKTLGRLFHRTGTNNAHETTATNTTPFPFLRLPRELRNQIYQDLLTVTDNGALWIRYSLSRQRWWDATPLCQLPGPRTPRPRLTLGLLLTCKTIHTEAREILLSRNKIWLDAPPAKCLSFLTTLPPTISSKIHHLKLWMDVYLNCGMSTGNLPHLTPDEITHHTTRVQDELLPPWEALFPWIHDNLPLLHTLHIRFGPNRTWHTRNLHYVSPQWHQFYQTGWMQHVRETTTQIQTLLVESDLQWCDQLDDAERVDFQDLRRELHRHSGFREALG
ncbi:hypothetical protein BO82DRAFT_428097 [Aspergillus uvarum CBS 121591]|uniref:F-box domain-containing protein n=1 Tax=Aspergillus uvarum CBS 121591 TaxID=1448315 RepID=A0A319CMR6_9EURO|nr:hypothetical protein BO82DRAFT_428097 [Aspergillus uvarum CBS 121591]PYH86695.1 hypothetical protein BO82DRAFT_428097 [Aspergillus uvarum CBS 121591]